MHRMLVSRISRRVLAEHHVSLTEHFRNINKDGEAEPHVGIIFTGLNVQRSLARCAKLLRQRPLGIEGLAGLRAKEWPEVIIDGHVDMSFAYIREQLEYVLYVL